jgi:hypothetical protein
MGNQPVQFIVETQVLLTPFLKGRHQTHFLYKVCRAETPEALYSDFRHNRIVEALSFQEVEDRALNQIRSFMAETNDINRQHEDFQGATMLWKAAEEGHEEAVREILQHHKIDPNKLRQQTRTTPLYIAAYHGHTNVVKALLSHPKSQVDLGQVGTGASPLLVAAEQGHEDVVKALLEGNADVNKADWNGATPLCMACERGNEHIVEILLATESIDIYHKLKNGTTAISLAASQRHTHIVEMCVKHIQRAQPSSYPDFPSKASLMFSSDSAYRDAVLEWTNAPTASKIAKPGTVMKMERAKPNFKSFASFSKLHM